tara:strand:+ start:426 stop:893 length:468 start_codon:yes stop_codon:yes gene_type:complete
MSKIVLLNEFLSIRKKIKNKKIVFTNGCFDILHSGHVKYLEQAKGLGDILIIGINSDDSVRKLKGDSRPINTLNDRAYVLSGLTIVDYIIAFDELTPLKLISQVLPDILVKGGDYKIDEIVGNDFVEKNGGIVKTVPYLDGASTTDIINKIKEMT